MESTLAITMGDSEMELIGDLARTAGVSPSDWARGALMEAVEDAIDARIADEAYEEYLADPVTYSSEEIMREWGLL